MTEMTFRDAIRQAMIEEMINNPNVFLMGEDIGLYGGCFQVTKGLIDQFGEDRVLDTPISESGFVGAAIGAAVMGLSPIVELQFSDFLAISFDQMINSAAKMRYVHGGKASVPMVLRLPFGAGRTSGVHHSQSPEAWCINIPGLKIVMPSSPYDAKGLLKTSIRDPNPILFFENKLLYGVKEDVPEEEFFIPLGKATIKRSGSDITIVALGLMVREALKAAKQLEELNIDTEVIDVRTIRPLDIETIVTSVIKTTRFVIVHEAPGFGGVGAEIAAQVSSEAFGYLDRPILRVTAPETPVPFSPVLEQLYLPDASRIVSAVRSLGL